MSKSTDERAEQIYLAVYDVAAKNSEYLQPGGDQKLLLPELVISSLVSTLIVSFLTAMCKEAGASAFKAIRNYLAKLRENEPDTDELIQLLRSSIPEIESLSLTASCAKAEISRALQRKGNLSESRSRQISDALIKAIDDELGATG